MRALGGLILICITQGAFAATNTRATPAARATAAPHFELLIRHGRIVDGTGTPWYAGDVGIRDGRVAALGALERASAERVIDARGMVVAPGFIDMLGQSELTILVDPRLPSKIHQGITTEITGEGESVAPLNEAMLREHQADYDHYRIKADWRTLGEYFARLSEQGIGINFGTYVGATSVREMVLGYDDRKPSGDELKRMQSLVAAAMEQGALGLSSALQYPPAPYASSEELVALAAVAGRRGGIYATHMRSEGNAELAALDETFRIASEAQIPVEIFHLKASGKDNWGHAAQAIERIEAARARGLDVAADTYAYTAYANSLSAIVPPWAAEGGSDQLVARLEDPATRARIRKDILTPSDQWDNEWLAMNGPEDILIASVRNADLTKYQGKRMSEIASEWHEDPLEATLDFLVRDHAHTQVAIFAMSAPDVELILRQPWVSIDNDASGAAPEGLLGEERPHPRAYGTFPRILRKFVRDEHRLTLEEAIRKFSALPAARLRLADRGVLKVGLWADIVIFDPEAVHDVASFEDPNRLSVGMRFVLVNGVPVIDEGAMTGARPGRILYGPGAHEIPHSNQPSVRQKPR